MIIAKLIAVVIIGYLLGSIPFGLLIARRKAGVDIRQYGSGKTGMTNVLRTAGRKAAALSLVLDCLKGIIAVILAGLIIGDDYLVVGVIGLSALPAQVIAALAAVAGHNWSVFIGFQGGRGVATFFGGLLALCLPAALFGIVVLFAGMLLTRYASLGSIAGMVAAYSILVPLTIINSFPVEYLAYTLAGMIIIVVMHRGNISRLISGRERRLGDKVKELAQPPSTGDMV